MRNDAKMVKPRGFQTMLRTNSNVWSNAYIYGQTDSAE